jgi:predicted GIY-YIG superfamily endonuclease
MADICSWSLPDGRCLDFYICGLYENWEEVAGLYIFCYKSSDGWYPLYIGQTEDFSVRLPNHERFNEAVNRGATHIHAVIIPDAANRDKWEKSLIQYYQPKMNDIYRNQ